jgi:hypothetical protein
MFVARAARGLSHAAGAQPVRIPDGARDASHWLDRYLEGWAEVNPGKIFAATAYDYCFNDPLVGQFSRWSVRVYFERLRSRFACAAATTVRDLAVFIHGPMDGSLQDGPLTFFREAPRLGLTGVTIITIGERGVIAETVAYDLNLASDRLRDRA